jgi:hypothetical protein
VGTGQCHPDRFTGAACSRDKDPLVVSIMIKQQRRLEATMEEVFTKEELNIARRIFSKYKAKLRCFREQKVSDEVVRPKMEQLNAYTWLQQSA